MKLIKQKNNEREIQLIQIISYLILITCNKSISCNKIKFDLTVTSQSLTIIITKS